ncbi:MAG: hypothetical protein ABSH20_13910 [Tepidisphaeraceae bacterium]|jgi:translation elongation factor EF-Tu-like GTPase
MAELSSISSVALPACMPAQPPNAESLSGIGKGEAPHGFEERMDVAAQPPIASPTTLPAALQEQDSIITKAKDIINRINTGTLQGPQAMAELLGLQVQAQQASFRIELVSKVIDNGTSGTRTVLQTQA